MFFTMSRSESVRSTCIDRLISYFRQHSYSLFCVLLRWLGWQADAISHINLLMLLNAATATAYIRVIFEWTTYRCPDDSKCALLQHKHKQYYIISFVSMFTIGHMTIIVCSGASIVVVYDQNKSWLWIMNNKITPKYGEEVRGKRDWFVVDRVTRFRRNEYLRLPRMILIPIKTGTNCRERQRNFLCLLKFVRALWKFWWHRSKAERMRWLRLDNHFNCLFNCIGARQLSCVICDLLIGVCHNKHEIVDGMDWLQENWLTWKNWNNTHQEREITLTLNVWRAAVSTCYACKCNYWVTYDKIQIEDSWRCAQRLYRMFVSFGQPTQFELLPKLYARISFISFVCSKNSANSCRYI